MKRALLLVALMIGTSVHVASATPTPAQLEKERAEAAAKVYASSFALFKSGRVTVEQVNAWSVRMIDGGKTAFADHAKRALDLETEAKKMVNAGVLGPTDGAAATYFRIEADLWVARGTR